MEMIDGNAWKTYVDPKDADRLDQNDPNLELTNLILMTKFIMLLTESFCNIIRQEKHI